MSLSRRSPLQNRGMPTGEIVADSARGMFTGNRGILPFTGGKLGTSRWKHQHWIICTLSHPKGRYHGPAPARGWTPLFFLDEAVALTAGHRPCAYCRPDAYRAFKAAWHTAQCSTVGHKEIDITLHHSRVSHTRAQIRHHADAETLPNGSFILHAGTPHLILDAYIYPFRTDGYGPKAIKPLGPQVVLTPAPLIGVLRSGYRPILHHSVPTVATIPKPHLD